MLHFLLHACFGACYAHTAGADEWDDLDDGDQSCLNACGVVFFLVALAGYSALLVVVGGTAVVILGALLPCSVVILAPCSVDATISLAFHAYKLRQASAKAAQQSGGAGGAKA